MMRKVLTSAGAATTLIALALLIGCDEKKVEQPAKPEPVKAAAVVKPVAAVAPAEVPLEKIPAEEDFEQEATTEVTGANLNEKLDSLEKEIQAD